MPDSVQWEYSGLFEIQEVAEKLLKYGNDYRIWLFKGELGAGKTTLIKALSSELGVIDRVSSPTFSLVNEYESESGDILYHFDFYRVKDEEEAVNIGLEEYFYSGSYCFIEWPSRIPNLLPENYIMVEIKPLDENKRELVITKHDEA
ncbi:MAG: tRNA (adenosine(37)-N6)-threonylcarbamoyltransferase complex ATPase subunit type 1 TsaE [Candidatus Cyclobacteriaceae bacterium M2_1C_046]